MFSLALISFNTYALLDTFAIRRVMTVVEDEKDPGTLTASLSSNDSSSTASNATVTETGYNDEHISINISTYTEYDTTIHVADIIVDDPALLTTAFAQNAYGRNVKDKTSVIAESVGAILAINGDFYGARESGYVIRGGKVYRDTAVPGQEDLVIYADGHFAIINESSISADALVADGVVTLLSFGPALIEDSSIAVSQNAEVAKSMTSNPRTAIGYLGNGHYVFVVSDGRTSDNAGLTLYELAEFMKDLGVTCAYNLDGGGSSTMVFNGSLVNSPTGGGHGSSGGERSVSDIIYIGY